MSSFNFSLYSDSLGHSGRECQLKTSILSEWSIIILLISLSSWLFVSKLWVKSESEE